METELSTYAVAEALPEVTWSIDGVLGKNVTGTSWVFHGTYNTQKVAIKRVPVDEVEETKQNVLIGELDHENVVKLIHIEGNDLFKYMRSMKSTFLMFVLNIYVSLIGILYWNSVPLLFKDFSIKITLARCHQMYKFFTSCPGDLTTSIQRDSSIVKSNLKTSSYR